MHVIFLMMVSLSLEACGESGTGTGQQSTASAENTKSASGAQSGANLGLACDAVDTDKVDDIMGWDADKTTTEELLNRKECKLTVCHYLKEGGSLQVILRISQESEKAQANKMLDKLYNNVLTNGQENISYETLPTILGTETLFGMSEGMHGYTSYLTKSLRKRNRRHHRNLH